MFATAERVTNAVMVASRLMTPEAYRRLCPYFYGKSVSPRQVIKSGSADSLGDGRGPQDNTRLSRLKSFGGRPMTVQDFIAARWRPVPFPFSPQSDIHDRKCGSVRFSPIIPKFAVNNLSVDGNVRVAREVRANAALSVRTCQ